MSKKRLLRNIAVSEIGMGCMGLSHGYGDILEESYSIEAIHKALGYGCTFFDTAEAYSPNQKGNGHNEIILGKALKDRRNDAVIATKLHLDTEEAKGSSVYETTGTYGKAHRADETGPGYHGTAKGGKGLRMGTENE